MASTLALAIFLAFISVIAFFRTSEAASSEGFSVELIHRDSPKSPFYDPNSTPFSLLHAAVQRSHSRAFYFHDAIHKSSLSSSSRVVDDNFFSNIIPNTFEYLMVFYMGTPNKTIIAILDTGSDLIWIQCVPCPECHNSTLFDQRASSTYKTVSCNTDSCSALPHQSCSNSTECQYRYTYGDGSVVEGLLSTETIGFDSTDGHPAHIPTTLFGCTHKSKGTFDKIDAGLVGLGAGNLSLIRQLGSTIGSRFSYCLTTINNNSTSSRLNFGSNAIVSESNAVTTPLIPGIPDTFYVINLEQINVAGQTIIIQKPIQTNGSTPKGNIIVDSGTTLTFIDNDALQSLEGILKKNVSLPQVKDLNNTFNLCFDISKKGFLSKLPDITFRFSGGAAMALPPTNTFIEVAQNVICLAIFSNGANSQGINLFGNIAQQNFHISYDLGAMQLTFAPADCANI